MTVPQTEALAIVHAGLADVLEWLGEEPVVEHVPRHGAGEAPVAWNPDIPRTVSVWDFPLAA